jgi:hypothetical protein
MIAAAAMLLALAEPPRFEVIETPPPADQPEVVLSTPADARTFAKFLAKQGFSAAGTKIIVDSIALDSVKLEAQLQAPLFEVAKLQSELDRLSKEAPLDLARVTELLRLQDEAMIRMLGVRRAWALDMLHRLPPADRGLYLRDFVPTMPSTERPR